MLALLRGCDFNGLAPYMNAVTQSNEKITILGFVHRNWNTRAGDQEQNAVQDEFNQRDLKVLGLQFTEKHKERSDWQLYDPNDLKVVG